MKNHRAQSLFAELKFPEGFQYLPGYYDRTQQEELLGEVRTVLAAAPLFEQRMPQTGAPLSVRMSNAGALGWVTDQELGYRYQTTHPGTGLLWPEIPESLLRAWKLITNHPDPPNLCLINYYDGNAHLGLHQDRGADSLGAPVVSISLGDDAVFLVGGLTRKEKLRRIPLLSGDVVAFGGPARLIFHGVEGIKLRSSNLLKEDGRFNLTLRRIEKRM